MEADSLYFRGLSGRWRPLPTQDKWAKRLPLRFHLLTAELIERLARSALPAEYRLRDLHFVCHCEVCDAIVVEAEGAFFVGQAVADSWSWSRAFEPAELADAAGEHRHNDDLPAGIVRWYRLRAMGPWKNVRTSPVIDLLAADPMFARGGYPLPSVAVTNDLLARGRHDVPRAGGIEFPPIQIDPAEFAELRPQILTRCPALVDTQVPDSVTTIEAFTAWWDGVIDAYPQAARDRYKSQVFELGTALAGTKLDTPEYTAAYGKVNALMRNIITVLETYAEN